MRLMRSPPAAKNVATTRTSTSAAQRIGIARARPAAPGMPAFSVVAARSARSRCARHSATANWIAGRRAPSRRRSRSPAGAAGRLCGRAGAGRRSRVGKRTIRTAAQTPRRPAGRRRPGRSARPSGGSHSHRPSQDSARNRPTAVASEASAGHSRSHKIVQRARPSARASSACRCARAADARSVVAAVWWPVRSNRLRTENLPDSQY